MYNDIAGYGTGYGFPPAYRGLPGAIGNRRPPITTEQPAQAPSASSGGGLQNILPTPGQLGALAPLPLTAFGGIPYLDPTYMQAAQMGSPGQMAAASMAYPGAQQAAQMGSPGAMQAAQVDLSQMPGALSQFQQQLLTALQPQFAQQQMGLDAQLGSRGIFNSGAAQQLQNDLTGQQAAAVAGPLGNLVSQFAQAYTQGQEQNAAQQQEANQATYGGNLQQLLTNAGFQQEAGSNSYQGLLNTLLSNAGFQQQANQGSYQGLLDQLSQNSNLQQGANQFNAGAANAATGQNAQNYGDALNQYAQEYNAYLANLGAQGSQLQMGLLGALLSSYDPSNTAISLLNPAQAGSAYENAYNSALGQYGNFGGLFSNAIGALGQKSSGGGSPLPSVGYQGSPYVPTGGSDPFSFPTGSVP